MKRVYELVDDPHHYGMRCACCHRTMPDGTPYVPVDNGTGVFIDVCVYCERTYQDPSHVADDDQDLVPIGPEPYHEVMPPRGIRTSQPDLCIVRMEDEGGHA